MEIYEIQKAALVERYSSFTEEGEVTEEPEKPKKEEKKAKRSKGPKEPAPPKDQKAAIHAHEVDPDEVVSVKTPDEEPVPEVDDEEENNSTGGDI